ncbi:MAG: S-layer family protein, partial [Oscillatoria sp. PMC 1051.18]|nr:S-layer family protein [Oscillatoria sp. PMC 1051.18]
QASEIFLNRDATFSASTASGEGGNIQLDLADLLFLRGDSVISAEAGGTGDGGNVNIDATFIVAIANSDIIANAFQGRGGNIQINAQSVFGTQFRPQLTPTSDINASSEFGIDGVVEIDTPDLDPNQGLVSLPEEVIDLAGLIVEGCGVAEEANEFIVTGRGGLPPNPGGTNPSETILVDLGNENLGNSTDNSRDRLSDSTKVESSLPDRIVQAQGWIIGDRGNVILTATPPTVTPQSTSPAARRCQTQRGN